MQVTTVVVHGKDDGKEVDIPFSVNQQQHGETARAIHMVIAEWNSCNGTSHTVRSSGKTLGEHITVQLSVDYGVPGTTAEVTHVLKRRLEGMGLAVNPSRAYSYDAQEALTDVGLPAGKPAGDAR